MPESTRVLPQNVVLQECHTLIADGGRQYTFLPTKYGEVEVRYVGPRHSHTAVVFAHEARDLWKRLVARGFEKW